jgi:hypothetical protein
MRYFSPQKNFFQVIVLSTMALGCAVLHKTQLSDIDPPGKAKRVSIKVSETTVDLNEIADLAKMSGQVFKSKAADNLGEAINTYTALFQFGPRTGTPVYTEEYARFVPEMLRKECPTGHVTNILSTRETRSYPVVKGEIVRVDADCVP